MSTEKIPYPDKPELNIDPPAAERLKICGIASLCLFYNRKNTLKAARKNVVDLENLRSVRGGDSI